MFYPQKAWGVPFVSRAPATSLARLLSAYIVKPGELVFLVRR